MCLYDVEYFSELSVFCEIAIIVINNILVKKAVAIETRNDVLLAMRESEVELRRLRQKII